MIASAVVETIIPVNYSTINMHDHIENQTAVELSTQEDESFAFHRAVVSVS